MTHSEEKTIREKRPRRWLLRAILFLFFCGVVAAAAGYWFFARDLPSVDTLRNHKPPIATEVFTADHQKVGEFFRERRYHMAYEALPPRIIQAFLASEDASYFEHPGVSFKGIFRAAIKNIQAGKVRQGGSTITQQVAKILLLSPKRNLTRKIKEALLAFRMERVLSKERILAIYLNEVYLGHGAYGVEAASQIYFGHSITQARISDVALIAGLTKAPSRDNPFSNPARAKKRRDYVLTRMLEEGFITKSELDEAQAAPLVTEARADERYPHAAYLVEKVRRHLLKRYGEKATFEGGLQVYLTTTYADLVASKHALSKGLEDVENRQGYRGVERHVPKTERPALLVDLKKQFRLGNYQVQPHIEQTYQGLVTAIDDKNKSVRVNTGRFEGELRWDTYGWAQKRAKGPRDLFRVGDLIQVRLMDIQVSDPPPPKAPSSDQTSKSDKAETGTKDKTISEKRYLVTLYQAPEVQGALLSFEPSSGRVLAWQGGYDFALSQFNRVDQAIRQPGSALKPLIYSLALKRGYTAASVLSDAPMVFDDPTHDFRWKPQNFGGKFYGDTVFRDCLVKSRNVPTIKLVEDLGVDALISYVSDLNINTPMQRDLSIALGSSGVIPYELIRAYSIFPNQGRVAEPFFIARIRDASGKILESRDGQSASTGLLVQLDAFMSHRQRAQTHQEAVQMLFADEENAQASTLPNGYPLSPQRAYVMTHLLKGVVASGTGRRARALERPVAGKTGTTNDNLDAWFIGFTPRVLTGVWVGRDDSAPLGQYEEGSRAALPIWLTFMKDVTDQHPVEDFPTPEGVVFSKIDRETGKLAGPKTTSTLFEAFVEGTQPQAQASASEERFAPTQKNADSFYLNE